MSEVKDNLKEVSNSIIANRNEIRNALIALNISLQSNADLEACKDAIKGITNNSTHTSKLNPIICNFVANEDGFVYGSGASGFVTSDTVFKIPIGSSGGSTASSNIYNYVQVGFANKANNSTVKIPSIAGKPASFIYMMSTRGNVTDTSYNSILKYFVYSRVSSSNPILDSATYGGNTDVASYLLNSEGMYEIYTRSTSYVVDTSYFYVAMNNEVAVLFDIS